MTNETQQVKISAGHTPGPWTVDAKSLGMPAGTRYTAYELRGAPDVCDGASQSREVEANARLIAAAPDLLEAAIDLLDNGIEWRGGVSYKLRDASNSGNGGADQRIAALRAAIRKARGEGEA